MEKTASTTLSKIAFFAVFWRITESGLGRKNGGLEEKVDQETKNFFFSSSAKKAKAIKKIDAEGSKFGSDGSDQLGSLGLRDVLLGQGVKQVLPKLVLLLAVGQRLNRSEAVDDVSGLSEINLV